MNIVRKVRAVEKLFKALDKEVIKIQTPSGLQCKQACIHCCTTSHIMASPLEFYPLAYHLYLQAKAEEFLHQIELLRNSAACPVLNRFSVDQLPAGCSYYLYRGLICRIFPFNYQTDKHGIRRISACKIMKEEQPEQVAIANTLLAQKATGPNASYFYQKLQLIDYVEAQQLYPIGEAIRIAIEKVLSYFQYRGNRAV